MGDGLRKYSAVDTPRSAMPAVVTGVVVTLMAGVFVTICFSVIVVALLIAGQCRRSTATAAPASGCRDNDVTQNRVYRHEMRLHAASKATVKSSKCRPNSCFEPAQMAAALPTFAVSQTSRIRRRYFVGRSGHGCVMTLDKIQHHFAPVTKQYSLVSVNGR